MGTHESWPHYAAAKAATRILESAGFEAYIIGGAVRDILLGKTPKDFDLVTNATPGEILKLSGFTRSDYQDTSQAYGVSRVYVEVEINNEQHQIQLEIATYRRDIEAHMGRKQTKVAFAGLEDDIKRRDLTINALALNPDTHQVIDLVNGIDDIEHGLIRFIGNPAVRIQEDPLRLLRAIRLKNQLGFSFIDDTEQSIVQALKQGRLQEIVTERVGFELTAMLTSSYRQFALQDLERFGILEQLLPEVIALKGIKQPEHLHAEGDAWEHTMLTMQFLPDIISPQLAWAALFHDVGKADTIQYASQTGDRIRFNDHHARGAEVARQTLKRLRFGRRFREHVAWMIHHHLGIDDLPRMRPGRARHFMSHPAFADLLELHKADAHAAWSRESDGKVDTSAARFDELEKIWSEFQAQKHHHPPSLKHDLGIDGKWLMDVYKLPPGPQLGRVLRDLQEAYLDEVITDKNDVSEYIKRHYPDQK